MYQAHPHPELIAYPQLNSMSEPLRSIQHKHFHPHHTKQEFYDPELDLSANTPVFNIIHPIKICFNPVFRMKLYLSFSTASLALDATLVFTYHWQLSFGSITILDLSLEEH